MTEEFFMGLFDRFKKRVKQPTTEEEITVDENSEEAALAIAEREKNLLKINSDIQKNEENEDIFEIKEEWDNLENETLQNPFLSSKSSKERKKLQRDKKIKQTLTPNTKKKIKDPMLTTTGRKLIKLNRPIIKKSVRIKKFSKYS